jgi:HSP20 family protein
MLGNKELKVMEKQAVASPVERTEPGPVFTPSVDIFETDKAITLLVDMPGVKVGDLDVDLRDDTLTLTGDVNTDVVPPGEMIYGEYEIGPG